MCSVPDCGRHRVTSSRDVYEGPDTDDGNCRYGSKCLPTNSLVYKKQKWARAGENYFQRMEMKEP